MFVAALSLMTASLAAAWAFDDHRGCQLSRSVDVNGTPVNVVVDLSVLDRTFISFTAPLITGKYFAGGGPGAALLLLPSQQRLAAFWSQEADDSGTTVNFGIPDRSIEALASADAVQFTVDRKALAQFPMDGLREALPTILACKNALERRFDIDPAVDMAAAANAPLLAPAKGPIGQTDKDYPAEAIKAHAEGTTTTVWTQNSDGTTSDCRIVVSSGNTALDAASCAIVLQRIRYVPGPVGIRKYGTRRFNWRLPASR